MKTFLRIISIIGLILTILPSILVFANIIELATHKNIMLLGTVLWFFTAPIWMYKKEEQV